MFMRPRRAWPRATWTGGASVQRMYGGMPAGEDMNLLAGKNKGVLWLLIWIGKDANTGGIDL